MAGSRAKRVFNYQYMKKPPSFLPGGGTVLHSYRAGLWESLAAPHPHQRLPLSVYLILATWVGVEGYFAVVLICIFWWLIMLNMSSCACWSFLWLLLPLIHLENWGGCLSPCRHSLHILDTSVLLFFTVSLMSRSFGWCLIYGFFFHFMSIDFCFLRNLLLFHITNIFFHVFF